jgi:hypothetical protein
MYDSEDEDDYAEIEVAQKVYPIFLQSMKVMCIPKKILDLLVSEKRSEREQGRKRVFECIQAQPISVMYCCVMIMKRLVCLTVARKKMESETFYDDEMIRLERYFEKNLPSEKTSKSAAYLGLVRSIEKIMVRICPFFGIDAEEMMAEAQHESEAEDETSSQSASYAGSDDDSTES